MAESFLFQEDEAIKFENQESYVGKIIYHLYDRTYLATKTSSNKKKKKEETNEFVVLHFFGNKKDALSFREIFEGTKCNAFLKRYHLGSINGKICLSSNLPRGSLLFEQWINREESYLPWEHDNGIATHLKEEIRIVLRDVGDALKEVCDLGFSHSNFSENAIWIANGRAIVLASKVEGGREALERDLTAFRNLVTKFIFFTCQEEDYPVSTLEYMFLGLYKKHDEFKSRSLKKYRKYAVRIFINPLVFTKKERAFLLFKADKARQTFSDFDTMIVMGDSNEPWNMAYWQDKALNDPDLHVTMIYETKFSPYNDQLEYQPYQFHAMYEKTNSFLCLRRNFGVHHEVPDVYTYDEKSEDIFFKVFPEAVPLVYRAILEAWSRKPKNDKPNMLKALYDVINPDSGK